MNSLRIYKKFCLNCYFTIIINYCLAVLTLCMICYSDSLTQQFPWITIQTANPYLSQTFLLLYQTFICMFLVAHKSLLLTPRRNNIGNYITKKQHMISFYVTIVLICLVLVELYYLIFKLPHVSLERNELNLIFLIFSLIILAILFFIKFFKRFIICFKNFEKTVNSLSIEKQSALDKELLNKDYICNFKFTENYFIQLSVFESTILNYKNIRQVIDTPIEGYYRTTKRICGISMNILLCDKTSVIINTKSSNPEEFLALMKVAGLLKSKINNK